MRKAMAVFMASALMAVVATGVNSEEKKDKDKKVPEVLNFKMKKLDGVSEDDKKHAEKDLQKMHDDFIGKIDAQLKVKEAEIMEV